MSASALSIALSVAPVVTPVLLTTSLGYFWKKRGQLFDHTFITRLITHLGAPCLVFSTLSHATLGGEDLAMISLGSLLCMIWFAVLGWIGLRVTGQPWRVFLPSLMFPNIGNIGLPICLYAFGKEGLSLAMAYFTVCSVLQFTVGEAIAAGRFRASSLLKVPFLYAAVVALAFNLGSLEPPVWLDNFTTMVGGITVPLMLLALGVALAELKVTQVPRSLMIALGRMALGISGAIIVIWLFGMSGKVAGVMIIQSAMPVAVFNYLFARLYDNSPEDVAGTVVVSTVVSYLSLPLLVSLALLYS